MTSSPIAFAVFVVMVMMSLYEVNAVTTKTASATTAAAMSTSAAVASTAAAIPGTTAAPSAATTTSPVYRCYDCDSSKSSQSWCADPFPSTPPAGATYCNGTLCFKTNYTSAG